MRRPHLFVGGRLVPLHREPIGDRIQPALCRGEARCVECRADLADAVWSACCCLFRCPGCGSLYPLRLIERSAAA